VDAAAVTAHACPDRAGERRQVGEPAPRCALHVLGCDPCPHAGPVPTAAGPDTRPPRRRREPSAQCAAVRTAIVVPGSGHLRLDGSYRIGHACRLLVAEAERLATALPAEVVVFTGWSAGAGASEAEQMRDAWRGPSVELVVEPRARTTVSNATRSLPLLLEREIGLAVVVSTPLHLRRARLVFAPMLNAAGIAARFSTAAVDATPRAVVRELLARSTCRLQLRAARGAVARAAARP
jgi:uncharacterized SAM-binding protein YcdF (DUF218 family)